MNLHIVNIIIKREYLTRVKKKSFIITTFLVPVLFAALCTLPSVIMLMAKEEAKKIAVVDQSGIVAGLLEDTGDVLRIQGGGSCSGQGRSRQSRDGCAPLDFPS